MKKGFTLIELVVVIVIIGILVGLAMPQFTRAVEKTRSTEAVKILGILREAQIRYYTEKGGYYATNVSQLDIGYTTPKYFDIRASVTGSGNDGSLGATESELARVARNDVSNPDYGTYAVWITLDGNIICGGGDGACGRLGY